MIKDVHINNPSAPFSGDRIPFRHSSFRAELPRSRIFWRWLLQEKLREFAISAKLAIASFIMCAVQRHGFPAGANPARQLSFQPVAIGAVVEVTKRLKPPV